MVIAQPSEVLGRQSVLVARSLARNLAGSHGTTFSLSLQQKITTEAIWDQ